MRIDFASPANQPILRYLRITEPDKAAVFAPAEVNTWRLGTHPDLVDYLWALHPDCACVINKTSSPLLAHPDTGIIFGLAQGTSILALRLPEPERALMLAVPGYGASYTVSKTTLYARDIGADWVLIKPFAADNGAMCAKGFAYAALK